MAPIGWSAIQSALSELTESPVTQELCATLQPETDFESAQRLLEETSEMVSALAGIEPCPLRPFDDLSPTLQQAVENLFVEPPSCLQAAHHLRLARDLKKYFKKQESATLLKQISEALDSLSPLLKEIERCLDVDGRGVFGIFAMEKILLPLVPKPVDSLFDRPPFHVPDPRAIPGARGRSA